MVSQKLVGDVRVKGKSDQELVLKHGLVFGVFVRVKPRSLPFTSGRGFFAEERLFFDILGMF